MIVICTKCQAKFRVADEKIGARGAKVRCSKCQTVFVVKPEGAAAADAPPAAALGTGALGTGAPAAPSTENPFVASPVRFDPARPAPSGAVAAPPRAVPPPLPPPLPHLRAADPFAATGTLSPPVAPEAPAAVPSTAAPDPFAPDPFVQDPFAPAASPDPFAGPPASPADPFGAAAPPSAATDLGDLLGAAAAAGPLARAGGDADARGAAPEIHEVTASGIVLEERAPPKPVSSAPFDVGADAGYDAFAGAGEEHAFDPGALQLAGGPPAPGDAADAVPELARSPAAEPAARAAPAPRAAPALSIADPASHAHERIPGRPSRLRALALNAVALAALLAVALAILALWRRGGPVDAAALRPSALVAALRGSGSGAPFATREVRSGLYERDRAPPVLFVRGAVVSRAAAPVARVRVQVEILRAGAVVARGEAIAGAVPTPEELWGARDAAALAATASAAARRAPAAVRPGDAVPFLVAIADQPADLTGASLRVAAAPDGSAAP
ncbi:MAG TPA: zinc-ribbon domain-containing protein [Anaeromyxobacter sp.]|nr:zinc-ribbon domain-containing protein [Anaeromyxobacter sp.]